MLLAPVCAVGNVQRDRRQADDLLGVGATATCSLRP